MAIMYSIKNETPRALKLSSREFPSGMQTVLDRAFAKEIDKRYQTAAEFRDDLIALLPGGAAQSGAYPAGGSKPPGKNKRLQGIVLIFIAVASAALTLYLGFRDHGDRARAVTYYSYGQRAEGNDSIEVAREYYIESHEADKSYAEPWEKLGFFAFSEADYQKADSFYAGALDRGLSEKWLALFQRAECARALGDNENAKMWYRRSIDAKPDFYVAYNNYGELLRHTGELEAAGRVLDNALKQKPPAPFGPSLKKHRGLVAWELNQPDSARIYLEGLERVYADDPEFQRVWSELHR
jgi:tetratricopeptide (TPR) repeat protein